tara:strand:- start:1031 stop:1264 length:234 start_codon:yes stop_codon:yes gene_type:complete
METHKFPYAFQKEIIEYVSKSASDFSKEKDIEFINELVNPAIKIEIMNSYFTKNLKTFELFRNSRRDEILFIVGQMK